MDSISVFGRTHFKIRNIAYLLLEHAISSANKQSFSPRCDTFALGNIIKSLIEEPISSCTPCSPESSSQPSFGLSPSASSSSSFLIFSSPFSFSSSSSASSASSSSSSSSFSSSPISSPTASAKRSIPFPHGKFSASFESLIERCVSPDEEERPTAAEILQLDECSFHLEQSDAFFALLQKTAGDRDAPGDVTLHSLQVESKKSVREDEKEEKEEKEGEKKKEIGSDKDDEGKGKKVMADTSDLSTLPVSFISPNLISCRGNSIYHCGRTGDWGTVLIGSPLPTGVHELFVVLRNE
ncbi:uncharacterized protein MONOS_11735 [Monocercomonoides exilis]|uniref:uncharacterized protein n=1 Tax=Monocercomonoides exilis TaxID=2049356 RepID=UPI0035597524|nr:hypothetical protein MONOS_11735 [Monocercomonoides exilis]|eukprot:MONOS_11735.1-p1 / transcript=MONOS_11735.1 / gene=MONOS_11735 / organism=Monocercomonoides_exilis_PA203 / gene_product=unspecified product / transcript_product=unspecified product / location=Mono_scaffold00606:14021-15195(-) / protein_length=296 / sequence_SO=supercontig / SO=protein_coding / is_pseudo=false